jgi:hypothetical protein
MAKQKKHNWFTSLSFGTVALVLTVLLVLGYLSIIVPPEKAWFFTLFGLIYPVVLPATLILFVIALVRRSRTRLVLALALLPSLFFAGRYFQISAPKDAPEPTLTVVSYNVGLFRHGPECEDRLKEEVGITSRCMPFAQEKLGENCVVCGKPAVKMVYWGKAY